MSESAIGGYFELELPRPASAVLGQALRFQSARAAFLALLRQAKPKRVWMPHYICDSMRAPLRDAGVECLHYEINQEFEITGDVELLSGDYLYYVNYFGICAANVARLLKKYDSRQVILDCCQAWFAAPADCLAVIYSPRKFFGVPDGGMLVTNVPVLPAEDLDTCSVDRARYLLERMAFSPEAGYAAYKRAEHSLAELEPRAMSQLTARILASVDFEAARTKRNENFRFLHERVGRYGRLSTVPAHVDGPLCYPLLVDAPGLREHLIKNRIYVATYWPDVLNVASEMSNEATLVRELIPLPCDQRYGLDDMERVVATCIRFFENRTIT